MRAARRTEIDTGVVVPSLEDEPPRITVSAEALAAAQRAIDQAGVGGGPICPRCAVLMSAASQG
jgi:hypothetical protein